jgi:hypothetical protein
MKKTILGITAIYLSLASCQPNKISNSYQSNKLETPLIIDPFEVENSFAQMEIINSEKKDTIKLQTDNWGRTNPLLDTTKTYYAIIKPGQGYDGNPGDKFKPYKTKKFIPNKNLTILQKESELETLAKK